ncbi:SWF or SNF family helicase [Streptomyces sp. NPDC048182]|uniref:SWF or SNF family helicase n=1 Tax=Streptomyces sp. NPDC048182 TaxID=3365507 RepID=UPI00371ACE0E
MSRHDAMPAAGAGPERTFTAPPPPRGRAFAVTWWGAAWVRALEESALDSAAVKAGRRLARAGAVGAVTVRPGRVTAVVQGRDGTAHRADVLLAPLSDDQWDRFLDVAVERSGHVAALLDSELPPHLVEDAASAGADLLPGPGDLEAECGCGTWDHCGHTTALCYQVAVLLDRDPSLLLLMRGRDGAAVLAALQAHDAAPARVTGPPEWVDAAEAYATGLILPALPAPPALPTEPGPPPSLDTGTAPPPGVDPAALAFLASGAAAEAHRLLAEALRPGHAGRPVDAEPTVALDAVRLAAGGPEPEVLDRLGEGSGRDRAALADAVRAWRLGGAAAPAVLEEEWEVRGEALVRARAALEAAWEDDGDGRPVLRQRANRWTVEGAPHQLRLDRQGRWWPYRREGGRWLPAGGGDRDPAAALASAALAGGDEP